LPGPNILVYVKGKKLLKRVLTIKAYDEQHAVVLCQCLTPVPVSQGEVGPLICLSGKRFGNYSSVI
jgi:hypothetical protein